MRLFSISNVLLLLVIMATHEGAHLDGLLTQSQMRWINVGAKVMMTGHVDAQSAKLISSAAQDHTAKLQLPNYLQPTNGAAPMPNFLASIDVQGLINTIIDGADGSNTMQLAAR